MRMLPSLPHVTVGELRAIRVGGRSEGPDCTSQPQVPPTITSLVDESSRDVLGSLAGSVVILKPEKNIVT